MKTNIKKALQLTLGATIITSGVALASTSEYKDITIPGTVSSTDAVTDTWGNSINTAIKQLADKTKVLTDAAIVFANHITLQDGDVGIGTNSPESKLHVNGDDANNSIMITAENRSTATGSGIYVINHNASESAARSYITLEGNKGKATFITGGGSTYITHKIKNADGTVTKPAKIRLSDSGDIILDATKNVGIGTNSPESKLHVNGDVTLNPNPILPQVNGKNPVESERLFNFTWPNNNDGSNETDDANPNNSTTGEVAPWFMYLARSAYGGNLQLKPRNLDGSYKNAGITFKKDGTIATASDERFKDNIETLNGLEIVEKLRGVSFNWKDGGAKDMGFIAQEVEKVFPSLVTTDPDGYKSLSYNSLISPLFEAVKEQQTQIESQQTQIDALIKRIEALEQQ